MNIQSEIQKSIALLRQAEDKIIEKGAKLNKWDIADDIWTVRNMMDGIHHQIHQSSSLNQKQGTFQMLWRAFIVKTSLSIG